MRRPPAPLPDAGFSARVLAALPPPANARPALSRTAVCVAGAAIGTLIALVGVMSPGSWTVNWAVVQTTLDPLQTQLLDPTVVTALTVAAASMLYAFRSGARRLLVR